jgi:hypothetical protein
MMLPAGTNPTASRLDRLTVEWIDTCECSDCLHVRTGLRADGATDALAAVQEFLRGSWFCDASLGYPQRVLRLIDGDGVNLREEGQVLRRGSRLLLWTGMSYFEHEAEADLDFAEFCEVLRPFIRVIELQDHVRIANARLARVRYSAGGPVELLPLSRNAPPDAIPRSSDLRVGSARIPLRQGFSLSRIELQGAHAGLVLEILNEASGHDWKGLSDAMLGGEHPPIWQSPTACIVRERDWLLLSSGRDQAIAIATEAAQGLMLELRRIEALSHDCKRCEGVLQVDGASKARIAQA